MNERIKTLIKESGGHNIAYEGRPGSYSYAFTDNSVEKFAELIVRECISILEQAENGYKDYRNQIEDGMRDHCIGLIKHKFGVEE